MKKPEIGDLIEIKTNIGLAYAQYTHYHEVYGALIRVFNRIYRDRPEFMRAITNDRIRFSVFFPLKAALKKKIVEIVGHEAVKEDLREFPLFRAGVVDPSTQKVAVWWLWDGEKEWKIGQLDANQSKLPIRGVWNDTLLIQRIEAGWTPENDPTS